jgi:hypothetical protein
MKRWICGRSAMVMRTTGALPPAETDKTHGGKSGGTHRVGVPEPGSLPLMILGAVALLPAGYRRRSRCEV